MCLLFIQGKSQVDANNKPIDIKYRRSSLHTILVENDKFPYRDTVLNAYYNAPFPEKYNNQMLPEKSFNPSLYANMALVKDNDYPNMINNYLTQNKIASKLVSKWFNRQPDGSFNMDLVSERGAYNATEMEALIAQKSARGVSALKDAGEELIGNTFVVVSRFNFVSNAYAAAAVNVGATVAIDNLVSNDLLRMGLHFAKNLITEKAAEGYSVWCTSYLYKLTWNDSISSIFYNDYWMDKKHLDLAKKTKFEHNNLFKLEYVGTENSTSLITFSLKESRTAERYVSLATVRSVDKVYAKLQKKYDVFKTKTPLYTGFPITAKIGMKEGVEKGDKYEVLEQVVNDKGLTKYVRKGVISVDGKLIWDNRYNAAEQLEAKAKTDNNSISLDRTTFNGGQNYYPGMLIRQIK